MVVGEGMIEGWTVSLHVECRGEGSYYRFPDSGNVEHVMRMFSKQSHDEERFRVLIHPCNLPQANKCRSPPR
jgi:hypothetical protein